jgi:hypothetical protein
VLSDQSGTRINFKCIIKYIVDVYYKTRTLLPFNSSLTLSFH